jgi:hypothetical protein
MLTSRVLMLGRHGSSGVVVKRVRDGGRGDLFFKKREHIRECKKREKKKARTLMMQLMFCVSE